MVAHLHPRSRSTLSLFTTCLTISFLVVGAPHLLPCPVDRRQFADDGTGEPRKRRRRKSSMESEADANLDMTPTVLHDAGRDRECPIPKPGGLLGQVMGFKEEDKEEPRTIIVKSIREKQRSQDPS